MLLGCSSRLCAHLTVYSWTESYLILQFCFVLHNLLMTMVLQATPRPARRRRPAQRPGAVSHDKLSIYLGYFNDGCNLSDDASVGALVPSREGSVTQATLVSYVKGAL